jgi:transposase InsO family protein
LQRPIEFTTYASEDYQDLLEARGLVCSMSRRGNCWDNAVMESFYATIKIELGEQFDSHGHATIALFEYIGYLSPGTFEGQAMRRNPGASTHHVGGL